MSRVHDQIPAQRTNLMWGIGGAFGSYVATAVLLRRGSNLFGGTWAQAGTGLLVGSIAG
jgi:hypothetical protein